MLRKKEAFTVVTPIPRFIPRQLALDILHSHSEVITLNPLVLDHKPISAPRNAAADEYYSTWYEITQRIQFVPGMGNVGSGKITFNGCFHNMPWGLQTHIHAPFNIDMRYKYQIAGNQPGVEPPEPREIGLGALGAPTEGLYLREDIEFKCNFSMVGFVKSQAKAANKQMVERIVKKAELLDAGVLQAMMEDGRLKTFNPNDRSIGNASVPDQPLNGPYRMPASPTLLRSTSDAHGGQGLTMPYGSQKRTSPAPAPVELPGDNQHYGYYRAPAQPAIRVDYQTSTTSSNPRWSPDQLEVTRAETHRSARSSVGSSIGNVARPSTEPQAADSISELPAHKESNQYYK